MGEHGKPEWHHPKSEDRQEADNATSRQCNADRDAIGRNGRASNFAHDPRYAVRDALLQTVEFFIEVRLAA